jgi:Protein of unknown function (DUF1592)/Protein of unknown function (DUF1588)/Protein of unknown function (DUF1585)/Protein of unknown function (DUF1595)/Protein of unknown function (DUF1587)/Planctomycete cytochrome C
MRFSRHCSWLSISLNLLVWGSLGVCDEPKLASFIRDSCLECHTGNYPEGQFSVDNLSTSDPAWQDPSLDTKSWERILRKLRAGQMPPPSHQRPELNMLREATHKIESGLELHEKEFPTIPKTAGLRRLTRTEYQNAIRDLLGISINAAAFLPQDESSHGFDNITVGELTPVFISRALQAAQHSSRLALGVRELGPAGITYRVPPDRTQESHVEGLPLGSRGGVLFDYQFPQTGTYEFQVRLTRDRDEKVEGLNQPSEIDILVDRAPLHRFEIPKPPKADDHTLVDANLRVRLNVQAGSHQVGVTFPAKSISLLEIKRQPFDAAYNRHRHPRIHPAIYEVSIVGPIDTSPQSIPPTTSTELLFGPSPLHPDSGEQESVARTVLTRLARRAYRRPIEPADMELPMKLFQQSWSTRGFTGGLEAGISAILVNPNFLLRIESAAQDDATSSTGLLPVTDLELASRLSFFLWSSIPDDELLSVAEQGRLRQPSVLSEQVNRMLRDPRSDSLVTNFASQWLYLRNLTSLSPDLRLYPDFDDNLRIAMRNETEALLREVMREDQTVLNLIRNDHTFVNERLAVHYGINHVLGSQMQIVEDSAKYQRGGILRHASILAVTSYATRTAPTIRGNWILENILGTPAPPPPPNVPALKEKLNDNPTTTRERLALHRKNPACAACHDLMDPIGFTLENYDALGRWRDWEDDVTINAVGLLPDGSQASSVADLEAAILKRPEVFVGTLVEKLLIFGLGRGAEFDDGPHVRKIVREAAQQQYRFSSIIDAITHSRPFLMRH